MPRDTTTPADPLVVRIIDMGAKGYSAEVDCLSAAIECAADFHTDDAYFETTAMRWLDGDSIGEPVPGWKDMVREALAERRECERDNAGYARGIEV